MGQDGMPISIAIIVASTIFSAMILIGMVFIAIFSG